ncbi:MAG: NepR family anti-sigma factor [Pseudomonadota bacterium]
MEDIDKSLKAAFDDAATQVVPDRFIELLARLRDAEEKAARDSREGPPEDE